jgi:hypothetical protein
MNYDYRINSDSVDPHSAAYPPRVDPVRAAHTGEVDCRCPAARARAVHILLDGEAR